MNRNPGRFAMFATASSGEEEAENVSGRAWSALGRSFASLTSAGTSTNGLSPRTRSPVLETRSEKNPWSGSGVTARCWVAAVRPYADSVAVYGS